MLTEGGWAGGGERCDAVRRCGREGECHSPLRRYGKGAMRRGEAKGQAEGSVGTRGCGRAVSTRAVRADQGAGRLHAARLAGMILI